MYLTEIYQEHYASAKLSWVVLQQLLEFRDKRRLWVGPLVYQEGSGWTFFNAMFKAEEAALRDQGQFINWKP